jgi:hypothetical protein
MTRFKFYFLENELRLAFDANEKYLNYHSLELQEEISKQKKQLGELWFPNISQYIKALKFAIFDYLLQLFLLN